MKLFLVDQGNLQEVSKPVFSKGDVYVVDDDRTIYVWIGSKASVDEKTAGAAQARTLDQQRGGAAKTITVDENQESSAFLKLISSLGAMKVVEKNIAKTLLKDVSTGDWAGFEEWQNVLYRVSAEEFEGINAMKMIQVPFTKESLESEDCYVADLGNKVYIWQGRTCNVKEKVKAGQWARNIDAERAGSQKRPGRGHRHRGAHHPEKAGYRTALSLRGHRGRHRSGEVRSILHYRLHRGCYPRTYPAAARRQPEL